MMQNQSKNNHHRNRWFNATCLWGILIAVVFTCLRTPHATADNVITPEQKIKVAYLYNFIRYVQWSDGVFASKDSPFVIGILRSDSYAQLLERIAKRKLARNRKLVIRRVTRVEDVVGCHLVYLTGPVATATEIEVVRLTESQNALLVCDSTSSQTKGVPIRFFHDQDGTIGMQININALERRRLKADAKLLNVASVVR